VKLQTPVQQILYTISPLLYNFFLRPVFITFAVLLSIISGIITQMLINNQNH